MRKKRGAQPGNSNALKHGYYSKMYRAYYSSEERKLLQLADSSLQDEIALVKVCIRRVLSYSPTNREEAIKQLNVLSKASSRLANLIRTQLTLSPGSQSAEELLHEALNELWAEWDQGDYSNSSK
jgi:hypothetical protein